MQTNIHGESSLIQLFNSRHFNRVNINSKSFNMLFESELFITDNYGKTLLMHICKNNPVIIESNSWFVSSILNQFKLLDYSSYSALDHFTTCGGHKNSKCYKILLNQRK